MATTGEIFLFEIAAMGGCSQLQQVHLPFYFFLILEDVPYNFRANLPSLLGLI